MTFPKTRMTRRFGWCALSIGLVVASATIGLAQSGTGPVGSVTGTVESAAGEAMRAVVVKAKLNKMTVTMMSQDDGSYAITDLSPGTYTIRAERMGYETEPQRVTVPAGGRAEASFALSRLPNDTVDKLTLSNREMHRTLPASRFNDEMLGALDRPGAFGCEICHSFTGLAARRERTRADWIGGVRVMNQKGFSRVPDEDIIPFAEYLHSLYGPESTWEPTLPPENVDNIATNIRYVSFDLGYHAMPHTAAPDGRGRVFAAEFGGDKIAVAHVATGEVEEFPTPPHAITRAHGLAVGADGMVWFTQQGSGYIGRFDPRREEMAEYRIPASEHADPNASGDGPFAWPDFPDVSPHTITVDNSGNLWFTGGARNTRATILRKLNRETEEFTEVVIKSAEEGGGGGLYGVYTDPQTGLVWYAGIGINEVGYVDPATNEVTSFEMLSPDSAPRRLKVDSKGVAWVNQTNTNRLARIDPHTGTVTEWDLPGERTLLPYPTGIDAKDRIWVQTYRDDRLHMFDPETEQFTTFLMPDKGNGLRDFFLDDNGWLWAGVFGRDQIIGFKLIED